MQGIILQIVGLLIIITLIILFFSKPNVDNVETKTYAKLIGLNFLFVIIGITTYLIARLTSNLNLIGIFQKIYMSILTLLNLYSMYYCLFVYDKEKRFIKLKKILFIITIIAILGILFLPLNVIYKGDLLDGTGLSYNVAIGHTILSFSFFIIITIYLVIKKYSIKKIIPYIILIILYLVGFIVRSYYKELIFEGFFYSYILFIMYNTIENPDVKMAKELAFQKELAFEASNKTLNLICDIENNLKSIVEDLKLFGNLKVNEKNVEELNKSLSSFQNRAIKLSNKISDIINLAMLKSQDDTEEHNYKTNDMIKKLQELIKTEEKDLKINVKVGDDFPVELYGLETEVIKANLYFLKLISSLNLKKEINLIINNIQVGRFLKIRFNYEITDKNIFNYIFENIQTHELKFKNINNINYEIILNLLEKINGKIIIIKNNDKVNLILCINQRLVSEYDALSEKEENKNIKVKYHDYSNKRVLILDDNKLNIKDMKILFKPYKIENLYVNKINEMGNILSLNETFDLILIDSSYFKSDFDIINYIREKAKYKVIVIIMINDDEETIIDKYIKNGYDDYIIKPVNKKNLNKLLNKYFIK